MKQFQSLKRLLFFYTLTLLIMLSLYYVTIFIELKAHYKQYSLQTFNILKYEFTHLPNPTNAEVKSILQKPFLQDISYQIIFMHASGQTYIHSSTRPDERPFATITLPSTQTPDSSYSSVYHIDNYKLSAQLNFQSGQKIYILLRHQPIIINWVSYKFWLPLMVATMLFTFTLIYILKRRDDWNRLFLYADNLTVDTVNTYLQQPFSNLKTTGEFLRFGHVLSRISYQLQNRHRRIKTLRHRLERMVDNSPLPMLMIMREGNISFFNQRFEQVFTTSFQHEKNYTLTDFVMGSDKATQQQLHNLSTQRISRTLLVYALEDKQAYQLHIAPWFGEHEQIHGFTVLLSNVNEQVAQNTDIQRQNQQLHQKISDMTKLKSVMSHELRTPLNAIIGTLDLVEPETLSAEQQEVLDTLMQSSHSMLMMLNDMLDIAKLDAGKLEIRNEPTDIFKLSQHISNLMVGNARRQNLELLTLFMPDSPRYIDTDSTRLQQILLNLLDNAIKFTRSGHVALIIEPISHLDIQHILNIKSKNTFKDSMTEPSTAVNQPTFQLPSINRRQLLHNATDQQQLWICFSIQDTGIGITAEEQQQLFTYFTQANTQIRQQFGGTGLGLAISNSFAQLLGGFIQLTSEKEVGSVFNLYLPSHSHDYQPVYHSHPDLTHIHLIAIINQPLNVTYLQRLCAHLSIKANIYHNFNETVHQQLQQKSPTHVPILLLDYESYTDNVTINTSHDKILTNNHNGLSVLIESSTLPKILLSRTSERGISAVFLDKFDSFLTKPLDAALLLSEMIRLSQATIKTLIPNSKAHEPNTIEEPSHKGKNPSKINQALQNRPLILVVEDNITNQKITCKLLEKMNYRSIIAEDGKQALDILAAQRSQITLVLMDCRMPVMDGFQATQAIRDQGDDITIIALTANNTEEDRLACLAVGMNDFLAKPVNKNKMNALLAQYIITE